MRERSREKRRQRLRKSKETKTKLSVFVDTQRNLTWIYAKCKQIKRKSVRFSNEKNIDGTNNHLKSENIANGTKMLNESN